MTLKRLTTAEMLDLSKPWVDAEDDVHKLLLTLPTLPAFLPLLAQVHAELLGTQPETSSPRLDALTRDAGQLDDRHDDLIRGVYYILTGLAMLAHDQATRERYLDLRDRVLPEGLSATGKSYREEAGQALLLESRLDPPTRAQLDAIPLPENATLTDATVELVQTGRRIGQIEDERVQEQKRLAGAPSRGDQRDARNRWIRVVNTFVSVVQLAPLGPEQRQQILGSLEKAVQAAERRAARRSAREGNEPAPTTPPAPGEPQRGA